MKSSIAISKTPVAVVIPAYRAAAHIAGVLRGIPSLVEWIIVVDDCSPDDTADVVQAEMQRDKRICLLRHEKNQGVGGAVLTGYDEAYRLGAAVVVKMDSDGQMDPLYLPALIDPIVREQTDYTKGNRYLHARQLRSMPLIRRVGNLGLSFLTKLASGYWNVFDPTNGYTAIHAALIPLLNREGIARRYFFESSLLLELSLLRAVVHDISIPAKYGNEISNLSITQTLRQFPGKLLKGFCRRLWIQYFVRDFSIASLYALAGLTLLVSGTVFGTVQWCESAYNGIASPTGTVMLAALPVLLGIQFLLQATSLDIHNQPTHCLHHDALLTQEAEATNLALSLSPGEHSETPLPRRLAA
jgi:dolichol-phosphate mannosyltransferase